MLEELELSLEKMKSVSYGVFQSCYDKIVSHLSLEQSHNYDIASLIQELEEKRVDVENISSVSVKYKNNDVKIFPYAEYDWDGGSPIMSFAFNLNKLVTSDIAGGPISNIVTLKDNSYPGIAIHDAPAEGLILIQLFI